jgi:hypothetical protein
MNLLVVVNGVSDYSAWRQIFDEDAAEHAKFSSSMIAGPVDNGQVAIVGYDVDMSAMGAFMGTPEFAERTIGMQGEVTIYELSEIAPPAQ